MDLLAIDRHQAVADGLAQAFGRGQCRAAVGVGQDGGKLFTSQPPGQVTGAQDFTTQAGKVGDHLITGGMAILIVDVLEVVQIHHQHRHRRLVALAALEFAPGLLQEVATVIQMGQFINGGQLHQLLFMQVALQGNGGDMRAAVHQTHFLRGWRAWLAVINGKSAQQLTLAAKQRCGPARTQRKAARQFQIGLPQGAAFHILYNDGALPVGGGAAGADFRADGDALYPGGVARRQSGAGCHMQVLAVFGQQHHRTASSRQLGLNHGADLRQRVFQRLIGGNHLHHGVFFTEQALGQSTVGDFPVH